MGMKLGLLDVLRLCAVLVKKLLSWLLLVTCVCGVILHYLLLIIDWIVRETEEHQQLTGKDVKLETPEDTADDGDDELQYPVSCESASEDEQVITSALTVKQKLKWSEECCSEADDPQDLVMTVAKIPDCYREQILQDKASSKDIQEDASIVVDSCDESEDEEDSKADCLNL